MSSIPFTSNHQYYLAKYSAVLCFVYGLYFVLVPHKGKNVYLKQKPELKDPHGWDVFDLVVLRQSMCILTPAVVFWLHVEAGISLDESFGVALIPWIVMLLHSILNETLKKKVGAKSASGDYSQLIGCSVAAFATLSHSDYSKLSVKVLGV